MAYQHDIDYCFPSALGDPGLTRAAFAAVLAETRPALDALRRRHDEADLPLLALPALRDDLTMLEEVARHLRQRFTDLVVLGTGGSSLGARTLLALATGSRHGGDMRVHVLDNIDPHSMDVLIDGLDLKVTAVLAVSKSGGTAETLAQLLAFLPPLRDAVGEPARHVTVITEQGDNPLRRLAEAFGFRILDHDPGVGGRFSVLSLVGLLPAMAAGIDAVAVREGAARVLEETLMAGDPERSEPAVGAALSVALERHCGATQTVMMPYIDRLDCFALWYRQLWAESLGKDGHGTTPVKALGATDQHSQLQLYLGGPGDKMYSLLVLDTRGQGRRVATELAGDERLAYLDGATIGDLMHAEQRATAETLARRGRPVRVFGLDAVDAHTLGALFMHFMLETIIAAHLLGVDPFDQPAVEEGKVLARRYLETRGG